MTGANAEYLRARRAANPDYKQNNVKAMNARGRAQRTLARRFPVEYTAILNEERAKEGLRPLPVTNRIGRPKVKPGEGE